jgi:hypothetical protein
MIIVRQTSDTCESTLGGRSSEAEECRAFVGTYPDAIRTATLSSDALMAVFNTRRSLVIYHTSILSTLIATSDCRSVVRVVTFNA